MPILNNPAAPFPDLTCRYCDRFNPMVFYAPVWEAKTCVCLDCAVERQWVDKGTGNINPGVSLGNGGQR